MSTGSKLDGNLVAIAEDLVSEINLHLDEVKKNLMDEWDGGYRAGLETAYTIIRKHFPRQNSIQEQST